jgi:hypothetical protein
VSTSSAARSTSPARTTRHDELLKVTTYDRAASLLVSLLMLVGLGVAILTMIWITTRVLARPAPPMIALVEEEPATENADESVEISEPGIDELDLVEPDVQDTLAAVTDAVSSVAASLDAIETAVASRGSGFGQRRKRGSGDQIPRWQRWEIRYLNTTLEAYVKQLEFFGIELAAMGGGRSTIDYGSFKSGRATARSSQPGEDDQRLYFIWQGGRFREQDRALLTQAGINTTGRVLCQFYPPEIENQLAALEQQKQGGRALRDIKKTIFGVRPAGRGYEFYVIEIQWRA